MATETSKVKAGRWVFDPVNLTLTYNSPEMIEKITCQPIYHYGDIIF